MPDDSDLKKPDASRILFGIKDAPEPPKEMYRQGVHFTPGGTATPQELTREGRAFMGELAQHKADAELQNAAFSNVPRVPPRAKSQERFIARDPELSHDKMRGKDKGEDLDR